jgi:hypothetical protein
MPEGITELRAELQAVKSKLYRIDRDNWKNDFNAGLQELRQLFKILDEKLKKIDVLNKVQVQSKKNRFDFKGSKSR